VGLVTPGRDEVGLADVALAEGRVAAVSEHLEAPAKYVEADAAGLWLLPGLCDLHTHLREPGAEHKETVASGTAAAARGGFTTVCAMANTQPPADSTARLRELLETVGRSANCRVLPLAAITRGLEGTRLTDMGELASAGAVAFSDDGRTIQDGAVMARAVETAAILGLRVHDHCESEELAAGGSAHDGVWARALGLPVMPAAAEEAVIARDIELAERFGAAVHLCHISTAQGVQLVRAARAAGTAVSGEATPHHLALDDSWLARDGAGGMDPSRGYSTFAKVNPPLRAAADAVALREGVADGTLQAIATDHAPHALEEKRAEWHQAPFGISGLDTALAVVLELVRAGELPLGRAVAALTLGPLSLLPHPWKLAEGPAARGWVKGAVADVTLVDPELRWTVAEGTLWSKGCNTPLLGGSVQGRAVATLVGGHLAFADPARASAWGWADLVDERGLARPLAGVHR
jgi:dihydroorotase